jgi:hypothetical protein
MQWVMSWVWNADEADRGALLLSWGLAMLWPPQPGGVEMVIGAVAVADGVAKLVFSTTRLGRLRPGSWMRLGLPIVDLMIWLGACLVAVASGWGAGWGGWASVLYGWMAYRSVKAFYRLLTKYVADQVLEQTHGAGR